MAHKQQIFFTVVDAGKSRIMILANLVSEDLLPLFKRIFYFWLHLVLIGAVHRLVTTFLVMAHRLQSMGFGSCGTWA